MADIELKPCSSCGCSMSIGRAVYRSGEKGWGIYGIHDKKCLFEKSNTSPLFMKSKRELAMAWNRRQNNG